MDHEPPRKRASITSAARHLVRAVGVGSFVLASACGGSGGSGATPFPASDSPAGAYAHVSIALAEGRPEDTFAYLEDEAQWAAYTIRNERRSALETARKSFPADEVARLVASYGADADARDGADVFVRLAKSRGWFNRLRRDLSGVARTEVLDDRATIVTARGTRYPLRRRKVGIWGLTMFTAELMDDAQRATRDRQRIDAAARDYDKAAGHPTVAVDAGDAGSGAVDAP